MTAENIQTIEKEVDILTKKTFGTLNGNDQRRISP